MAAAAKSNTAKFFQAIGRAGMPFRVGMVNRASSKADTRVILEKFESLRCYRDYLAAARAEKARRKGVSMSFERAVQEQARNARKDVESFAGAMLRLIQQYNQTKIWDQMLDKAAVGIRASGPVNARELWRGLRDNDAWMSRLRESGVSSEMEGVLDDTLESMNATVSLRRGKPIVEVLVPGQRQARRFHLARTGSQRTGSIIELLQRSDFDRVVEAFTQGNATRLDLVTAPGDFQYELADIAAVGAIAGHQLAVEHVRKLEDTGLATYTGRDPATFLAVLLVVAAISWVAGSILALACQETEDEAVCIAAFVTLFIAALALFCLAAALALTGNPQAAIPLMALSATTFYRLIDQFGGFSNTIDDGGAA